MTHEERAEKWLEDHSEYVHGHWPSEVPSLAEQFREVEREILRRMQSEFPNDPPVGCHD